MTNPPRRPMARYDDADTFVMPTVDDAPTEQIPAYREFARPRLEPEPSQRPLYRDDSPRSRNTEIPPRRYDRPNPEPVKFQKKRSRKKIFVIILASLIAIVLAAIAAVYFTARANIGSIERDSLLPKDRPAPPLNGPLNVLILGLDGRKYEDPNTPQRADTMMLAHIPNDRSKVYLISIPRDSWVVLPNGEWGKINGAHALEGGPGSVKAVEDLLGITISTASTVNFEGFINMTEVLGGVTVDNPIASYERLGNYKFPEGKITIQGKEALAFVRQRKELPNGDLDRTRRQRLVVRAVTEKLLSGGTFTNPVKLNEALGQLKKAITIDEKISDDQLVGLGLAMRLKSGKDVESIMVPTAGFATTSMGEAVNVLDEKQIEELGAALRNDTLDAYVKAHKDDDPTTGNMPQTRLPEGKAKKKTK